MTQESPNFSPEPEPSHEGAQDATSDEATRAALLASLPPGTIDYSENDSGKEFAAVTPFSYARMAHPHNPGEVLPAMKFVQGDWREPRATSKYGEAISPSVTARTDELAEEEEKEWDRKQTDPEDRKSRLFEYQPRRLEGRVSEAKIAVGGVMRRMIGRKTSQAAHPSHENHELDIKHAENRDLFKEENLLSLHEDIDARTSRAHEKAIRKNNGDPLTPDKSAELADKAKNKALEKYVGKPKPDATEKKLAAIEERKRHVDLARTMLVGRLAVADQHEQEAAERDLRTVERHMAERAKRARRQDRQGGRGNGPDNQGDPGVDSLSSDERKVLLGVDKKVEETIRERTQHWGDVDEDTFKRRAAEVRMEVYRSTFGKDLTDEQAASIFHTIIALKQREK